MLIDEQGRLFGRLNLIDALVGAVVLGLIPLTYGAFVLFHVPTPTITGVTPTRIDANRPATVLLTGTNLRTYLKVYLGAVAAEDIKFDESGRGRVVLPAMPAGTYDLVLADEAQEVARVPRAVTVVAPPLTMATVKVRFDASPDVLARMRPGDRDVSDGIAADGNTTAVLAEIGSERQPVTAVVTETVMGRTIETPQPMLRFSATLRVPVIVTPAAVTYHGRAIKVGGRFLFESAAGAMSGAIQDVQTTPPPPSTE